LEKTLGIIFFSLFFSGLAGIGTWGLVLSLLAIARGLKSKSWPTVEATINISRLSEWQDADSGGVGIGTIKYAADIEYSYEFNGVKHTSNRISSIGDGFWRFGSKERAEEIRAKYPSGGKVKVYCNPKRPQLSILETGFKPKIIIWLVLGIFALGMSSLLFSVMVLPEILNH
jgi:hypothetical protein